MSESFDKYMAVNSESAGNELFVSADTEPLVLEGLRFRKGESFRRLPANSPDRPLSAGVDCYANMPSGAVLRFKSDSDIIRVHARVRTCNNTGDIMTRGRSGFDLYAGTPENSRFIGGSRINFDAASGEFSFYATLLRRPNPNGVMREYQLYFPLYAEVLDFALGIAPDSKLAAPTVRADARPIVIYGTSIEQGCCASRPGLSAGNILSRMLNREVLCYGFSGCGHGEPELAMHLADIADPAAYILFYDANSDTVNLEKTLPEFTDIIRAKHPDIPVVTVSLLRYPGETVLEDGDGQQQIDDRKERTRIHRENLARRQKLGDKNIHFIDGKEIFGADFAECSADGVHPNDLGMYRIAQCFAGFLSDLDRKEKR